LVVSLAFELMGCQSGPRLVDIKNASIQVRYSLYSEGPFAVMVFPDPQAMGQANCKLLAPKAKAWLNGVQLQRPTGLYVHGEAMPYNRDCILEFIFPGPTVEESFVSPGGKSTKMKVVVAGPVPTEIRSAGHAWLRIADDSAGWDLAIPDAFVPRKLVLEAPADGVLRPKMDVRLRWYPTSDRFSADKNGLVLRNKAGARKFSGLRGVKIDGTRFATEIPPDLSPEMRGAVEIFVSGEFFPTIGPCPARTCVVRLSPSDQQPATANLE
jgi:hypothetical protein